mmetsp:Transcript_7685/g.17965  ORF Transcript_7685/g.17965 Transcript_7685/m.17965 type:complete len:232 (-) Transcript_7685:741-1436(-)
MDSPRGRMDRPRGAHRCADTRSRPGHVRCPSISNPIISSANIKCVRANQNVHARAPPRYSFLSGQGRRGLAGAHFVLERIRSEKVRETACGRERERPKYADALVRCPRRSALESCPGLVLVFSWSCPGLVPFQSSSSREKRRLLCALILRRAAAAFCGHGTQPASLAVVCHASSAEGASVSPATTEPVLNSIPEKWKPARRLLVTARLRFAVSGRKIASSLRMVITSVKAA